MVVMSNDELFKAATNGFAMYGALAKIIMEKHGEALVHEAVALMGEASGPGSGEGFKQGVERFASQLLESQLAGGWTSDVKVEGNKVILTNYKCPCYAGMRAAGLSHEETRQMCMSWFSKFPDGAKSVNPNIKDYWIEKYRSPELDYCLEVFEAYKKT